MACSGRRLGQWFTEAIGLDHQTHGSPLRGGYHIRADDSATRAALQSCWDSGTSAGDVFATLAFLYLSYVHAKVAVSWMANTSEGLLEAGLNHGALLDPAPEIYDARDSIIAEREALTTGSQHAREAFTTWAQLDRAALTYTRGFHDLGPT